MTLECFRKLFFAWEPSRFWAEDFDVFIQAIFSVKNLEYDKLRSTIQFSIGWRRHRAGTCGLVACGFQDRGTEPGPRANVAHCCWRDSGVFPSARSCFKLRES